MSDGRDPFLAGELARLPVYDHEPGFWDRLDRRLAGPGPGLAAPPADLVDADEPAPPGRPAGGGGQPWSRDRGRRGWWALAAAALLVTTGAASMLVARRPEPAGPAPAASIRAEPTTTLPAPLGLGRGPVTVLDRHGQPLPAGLGLAVVTATVEEMLASDARYLGSTDPDRRAQLVADGGLTVHTTIDVEAQRLAAAARDAGQPGGPVSITSIDPASGAIVVALDEELLAGSLRTRSVSPFEALIPMVLAAAFDRADALPEDTLDGTGPCEFDLPGLEPNPYKVVNRGNDRGRVATITEQVADRSYCAWVRLGLAVGLDEVVATGAALGVAAQLHPYPSLPLGAADLSVIDLASLYATLAGGGTLRAPYLIARVGQDDRVVYQHDAQHGATGSVPAIDADAACRVTAVLATVRAGDEQQVTSLDAAGLAGGGPGQGLYAGYTSRLATVVWVVRSERSDPGEAAAAIWNQFNVEHDAATAAGGPAGRLASLCAEPARPPRPLDTVAPGSG